MKIKSLIKKRWFANALAFCIGILFYELVSHIGFFWGGLSTIFSHLQPVIFALVIAYVMGPLVEFVEKKILFAIKSESPRRIMSVLLAFVIVILFIVITLVALIPQLADSIFTFANSLPDYISTWEKSVASLQEWANDNNITVVSTLFKSITGSIKSIASKLPETITNIVEHSVNFGKGAFSLIIASFLAFYFLCDADKLKKGFKRFLRALLPGNIYRATGDFWYKCDSILIRYIICDLLDGLVIGVINWIIMSVAGMQYATIISVVVGVTNLAPTFGPLLGAVLGAFILILINPWHALWFLIITIIIQTVDGYIIKPKLFGDTLGISGLWILVGIVVGGRMFGVIGILLAIPVIAIMDYFYNNYLIGALEERRAVLDEMAQSNKPESVLNNEKQQ